MTQPASPFGVEYASNSNCPLCATRPNSDKALYGHAVCRKCYYGFMNRRQLAYVIDALILAIPAFFIGVAVGVLTTLVGNGLVIHLLLTLLVTAVIYLIFAMKDGIGGQSPGKMATDVLVLDNATGKPISWAQSFKRNSFVLLNMVPILGPLAAFVLTLIIAFTLGKGFRLGAADTRVIWKKYANQPVFSSVSQPAFEVLPMAAVPT